MSARDVLPRPLDAAGHRVLNLGAPVDPGDATYTDNQTAPSQIARVAQPGSSRLAAPADHVHADPVPMRVIASGRTTVAAGARVTLVTFKRSAGELFTPGAFAYVADNQDGVTWENEVDGATHVALYHERTSQPDELRLRAVNSSNAARTLDWAAVGLTVPSA